MNAALEHTHMQRFANRIAAGSALAQHLCGYRGRSDVVVLALPRGGVPVGFEVARDLDAPLDVMVVRKLGAPQQPELALGAIASGGVTVLEPEMLRWFADSPALKDQLAAERAELARRERLYRSTRPAISARGKTAILVDDGAATGASMLAAVRAVRRLDAHQIVVALPVASVAACDILQSEADEVVCIQASPSFTSVGAWYEDFAQTTDEDVVRLLAASSARFASAQEG
jgi:putative phosphoribosyl transferase